MGKKSDGTIKIPRQVLGFKLSKGTRKDLRKVLKLIEGPEARGIAISAASFAFGYLAEKTAAWEGPARKRAGKPAAQSH